MNKETFWGILISQNPRITTDPHFSPESVRRFFDVLWDTAYKAGAEDMAFRHHEIADAIGSPPEASTEKQFIQFLIDPLREFSDDDRSQNPKKKKQ